MHLIRSMRGLAAHAAVALLAAVLLAAGAQSAAAQNVTTTGQIRGRVTAAEGNEGLASVVVVARNAGTGLERSALTDAQGAFVVRLLPPGTYNLRAQLIGYAEGRRDSVRVVIGQASTANLALSAQAVQIAGIEVSAARQPVNTTDAAVVQTVTLEQIQELPVLGRDFTDFINLSGLVSPDPGETTGGQFSIAGQRASQTNLQIDGVDANNAFFGENRGGTRIPFVFSLESIQEFQIITNGYDVEYGSYSGGIVNVVTRGGTNDFSGSGYINYRSDALTGRGFLDTIPVADYEVTQLAARLSGPIKRDKAFYLVSVDAQRRREPQLPLLPSDYAAGGERENPVVAAEIERFFDVLDRVYGISNAESAFRPFQTTNDVVTAFGRLDFNLSDEHRLSMRHNFAKYSNDNEFDEGFDFLYGQSRAEHIESTSNSFVAELQSVFSDTRFNVLRFQFSNEDRPRQGKNLRPALITRLSNGDQIGWGGTFVGFNNDLDERKIQLIDNFTQVAGDHTLKVGTNLLFTHNRNSFLPAISGSCGRGSQGSGLFCFGNLNDFEAGLPSSYQFNVWESTAGLVPLAELDATELSFYVQDEWRATPKLTLTAGLRHDRQDFGEDPGRVLDVERAFGFTTGFAPEDNDNISPRFSVAYDLAGDGRSVIRAGAGYFFGRVPYVIAGNVLGSQRPVFNLTCVGSIAEGSPTAPPSPLDFRDWSLQGTDNPTTCAGEGGQSGVPTYTLWHEDFEYPETFKGNLGYETLLGERTQVAFDLIYSRSQNLYTVRNLNLRPMQFTLASEGNRRIYTPEALFNPASGANVSNSRIFTTLGDVFVNYNDGRAEAWVATAEANHRFNETTSLRGSYTFTRSYDNSSYSCCTAGGGFANPNVGEFGPNEIGGFGDDDRAWGPSDFTRDHTFILSGFTEVPFGIQLSAIMRFQSGRPYTPEVSGDINGDGVSFNDRPYIFRPGEVPGVTAGSAADSTYRSLLEENDCIGEYVGQIIPRNTCRTPWVNQLDMRLTKSFETARNQRAEIQLDLFNVLNGIGQLNCDRDEMAEALSSGSGDLPGWCGWGRFTTVSGANRNLFTTAGFQDGEIRYSPSRFFGNESVVGSNLLLQFQAQVAVRYYF